MQHLSFNDYQNTFKNALNQRIPRNEAQHYERKIMY